MKRKQHNGNTMGWQGILTRAGLIIASVLLVVWALPRSGKQLPLYSVGSPWLGSQVIAPFNFAVMKSPEAIKAVEDSIRDAFLPYFNYDTQVEKVEMHRFNMAVNEHRVTLPTTCEEKVRELLSSYYAAGIMSSADYNNVFSDSLSLIRLVSGKTASTKGITDVFSQKMVYEGIFGNEALAPYRQDLQRSNINEYIEPNLLVDSLRSASELNDLLNGVVKADGMVLSGQKIVDRGDLVTPQVARTLVSYEKEMERRNTSAQSFRYVLTGQIIMVVGVFLFLAVYLILFRRDYYDKPRSLTMLFTVVTLFPCIVAFFTSHVLLSVYIVPLAIAPMFIRIFLDSRTAFMAHVAVVLLCSLAVRNQYEFTVVSLTAGWIAIYSLRELTSRAQIYRSSALIAFGMIVVYTALHLLQTGDNFHPDTDTYKYIIVNCVLLLLAYPLMYMVEKLFGFTSDVTLFELSNSNQGLLRQLGQVAPSTLSHSITVGNLAFEIANRIGAEALLVRTGALYHDIGKMANPVFFTENQKGVNPHDNLTCQKSAQIIISHVTEGVRMAEEAGLPRKIVDFIRTHHGEGMTRYFYVKYANEHPGEEVPTADFTYPGPNPFTREQAILMMADTVEAASHSLQEYSQETITSLVNKLVDAQVNAGHFHECEITFRDIADAKQVLIEQLMAIYHTRIAYPELKKPAN